MSLQESNEKAWDEADEFDSHRVAVQIGHRHCPLADDFEAVAEMGKPTADISDVI